LAGRLGARPEPHRNGGFATRKTAWPAFPRPAIAAQRPNTGSTRTSASWLDTAPPEGCANWTGPLIAKALGDVHVQQVWRFLRAFERLNGRLFVDREHDGVVGRGHVELDDLGRLGRKLRVVADAPRLAAREIDLVRAQGYLKLPNGRSMTGQAHDDKRHGTTTLFAALHVGSGAVVGRHYKRRRRVEFLDFMNRRLSGARNPRDPRQSLHPQAQPRHVAQAP
jgi:hypothetical protein